MVAVPVHSASGGSAGTVELDDAVFDIDPHTAVMHQVVTAQLANRRSGTQSTKTRAEVSGGGAKPWRQKGTGRARQGSTRSPQWVGGGVALGPKPRSYAQKTPKKMIRLALHSALSDRARDDKIRVVESWGLDAPKTKDALAVLDALGVEGRSLVVLGAEDEVAAKSLRNVPSVHVIDVSQLNTYDILCADYLVFTSDSVGDVAGPVSKREAAPAAPSAPPAAQVEEVEDTVEPVEEPAEEVAEADADGEES